MVYENEKCIYTVNALLCVTEFLLGGILIRFRILILFKGSSSTHRTCGVEVWCAICGVVPSTIFVGLKKKWQHFLSFKTKIVCK